MTQELRLQYCKTCINQKKDFNLGPICGISGRIADFEGECGSFQEDTTLKLKTGDQDTTQAVTAKMASQGKRFANYLIDQVVLVGISLLFGIALGLVLLYAFPDHIYILDEENKLWEYLIGFVLGTIYYSFFEGFTGRSLGKFFTKTMVVTEDGERPDFKTILVRSLCRHIPFNPLSFLSSDTVGWHDKFSGTRVVEID